MPGPGGGGGAQINSLMDLMQPAAAAQALPPTYGTWGTADQSMPGVPLWSSGAAPAGSVGAGGMPPVFSPPAELAKYFGPSGEPRIDDPRQVAAEAGISPQQLAGGLFPRLSTRTGMQAYEYPSDKGGFFKIEDLFRLTGRDVPAQAMGGGGPGVRPTTKREGYVDVPQIATFNMGGPSTNNWRLLGMGPGWIMRNSDLINTRDASVPWGFPAGRGHTGGRSGEQSMLATPIGLGSGALFGMPNLYSDIGPSFAGWPGAEHWWPVHPGST
jgi:hypothetical protein